MNSDFLSGFKNIEKLDGPIKVKLAWLFAEWDTHNPSRRILIQKYFPDRNQLQKDKQPFTVDFKKRIYEAFQNVRGNYSLWGPDKEKGQWFSVNVEQLKLDWVAQNIDMLFGTDDIFLVDELDGIILWFENNSFKLLEGNHRISAWLNRGSPAFLSAKIFIGQTQPKH